MSCLLENSFQKSAFSFQPISFYLIHCWRMLAFADFSTANSGFNYSLQGPCINFLKDRSKMLQNASDDLT